MVGAAAGVVVGVGLAVALVVGGHLTTPGPQRDLTTELTDAFRRSRESTFRMEADFTRTMADGRSLSSAALVVQRPPDHLRRQLGGVGGAVAGRAVNCSTGPDGLFSCAPGAAVPPYQDTVEAEVANLRSYFDPSAPLYRVDDRGPGCFGLVQVGAYPDPPYGVDTTMCFDEGTGAMTILELRREGGSVDRLEATSVQAVVSDADFDLSATGAFDQRETTSTVGGG